MFVPRETTGYVGPNITGQYQVQFDIGAINDANLASGAFYGAGGVLYNVNGIREGASSVPIAFSASRVNSIYGRSSIVQPESIQLLACIKT